jgi:outer membrane protein, heavy metal efflux system
VRLRHLSLVLFILVLATPAGAQDPSATPPDLPAALDLGHMPDDAMLAQLLWGRSPDLVAARAKIATARGDVVRSKLLPNPSLDASWNTIPVGKTNPPGLSAPLDNVPNYAFSLSELVEIAKRGPRQRAARSALDAATLDAYELLRQRWYDLRERIAEVAAARVRVAALTDLQTDAHRLTELQRARAARGDTAGLESDRAALEEIKYQANLSDERQKLSEALVACAHVAGVPCQPFTDASQASAYLENGIVRPESEDLEARPDLRSLAAQQQSAEASLELARNRRIPDPTLRLGYVRDQFTIAGNQENSLFAGVTVPLPVFDRGQADAMQAAASAGAASRTRSLLLAQAERDEEALATQSRDVEARRRALQDSSLPLARHLVETLDRAVQQGGASLSELLLARRTLGELLLDSADVQLLSFHVAAGLARNGATGPVPPADLAPAL